MALNLWGLEQPTSYNPLPALNDVGSLNVPRVFIGLSNYTLKFKAKSLSGESRVRIVDNGSTQDILKDVTLPSTFKEYEYTFTGTVQDQRFQIFEYPTTNRDIIIQDIQLVEAPTGKATINGIDGFRSGKWSLHENARVIDDETLEMHSTADGQYCSILIPVNKGETYTISYDGNGWLTHRYSDSDGTRTAAVYAGSLDGYKSEVFTPTTDYFLFEFHSKGPYPNVNKIKKPQLNKGTTPAPYEPKRGERMVEPVAVKNLINLKHYVTVYKSNVHMEGTKLITDYPSYTSSEDLPLILKPNTYYVFSCNYQSNFRFQLYDIETGEVKHDSVYKSDQNTFVFKTDNTTNYKYKIFTNNVGHYIDKPQLESGTIATPFEPYAVQVNKRFEKRQASSGGIVSESSGHHFDNYHRGMQFLPVSSFIKEIAVNLVNNYSTVPVDLTMSLVEGSPDNGRTVKETTVTLPPAYRGYLSFPIHSSVNKSEKHNWIIHDVNDSNIHLVFTGENEKGMSRLWKNTDQTAGFTVTGGSYDFQAEYGNPRAAKGLQLDGKTGYVQLPSMTMDSVEIDCLIDSSSNIDNVLFHLNRGDYARVSNDDDGITEKHLNGMLVNNPLPFNERLIVRYTFNTHTGVANIFGNISGGNNPKGTLYRVTCYLAGEVVATYDFTQPTDGTAYNGGDPKNLLPTFDSGEWDLHDNFKVYGPNVGVLEATGGYQSSRWYVDCEENETFNASCDFDGIFELSFLDSNSESLANRYLSTKGGDRTETAPAGSKQARVTLFNSVAGTYTFQAPRLIKVPQSNATINGGAESKVKRAKRLLFAKR